MDSREKGTTTRKLHGRHLAIANHVAMAMKSSAFNGIDSYEAGYNPIVQEKYAAIGHKLADVIMDLKRLEDLL